VINALGIRGVGEVMASDLAQVYSDLDTLAKTTVEELQTIEGVGPNIAKAIVDWLSRPANQQVLEKLRLAEVWPQAEAAALANGASLSLRGLTFVVTGTLPTLSRENAREFIQTHGGKVVDSISKKTDYLVLGENPGSKFAKAQSLGISVLDEAGLRQLADSGPRSRG
jgi:DNA ligase (NAD+)